MSTLGVALHDLDKQIAAEPVEVVQAEQDQWMAGHEPVEPGLLADQVGSADDLGHRPGIPLVERVRDREVVPLEVDGVGQDEVQLGAGRGHVDLDRWVAWATDSPGMPILTDFLPVIGAVIAIS